MPPLPSAFYDRPTLEVLEDLIGKVLVHERRGRRVSGVIVEGEAYIGEDDPACHAAPGPTPRNAPLYGPPGIAYVYFNYGVHYLVNAVTEPQGRPAAVLIRALEPREGEDVMRRRRARVSGRPGSAIATADLCRGPGNLTAALGIALAQNRLDLADSALTIEDHGIRPPRLAWSPRVGIRVGTEHRWRCFWADHPSVSGPRARAISGPRVPSSRPARSRPSGAGRG
jgi:DNA-3-methyladenine glycosylase